MIGAWRRSGGRSWMNYVENETRENIIFSGSF